MFRIGILFVVVAIFVSLPSAVPAAGRGEQASPENSPLVDSLQKISCPDTVTLTLPSRGSAAAESLFTMPPLAKREDLPMWVTYTIDDWLSYTGKRYALVEYAKMNITLKAINKGDRQNADVSEYIRLQEERMAYYAKLQVDFECAVVQGAVFRIVYDEKMLSDPLKEQDRMLIAFWEIAKKATGSTRTKF